MGDQIIVLSGIVEVLLPPIEVLLFYSLLVLTSFFSFSDLAGVFVDAVSALSPHVKVLLLQPLIYDHLIILFTPKIMQLLISVFYINY